MQTTRIVQRGQVIQVLPQNFHSARMSVRNSTCRARRDRESRADGVPYSQPHPSPGFTISVSPRVFISC